MKKVYLFILFIILLQTNGIAASWKYSKIKHASVYQAQVCYAKCLATYLRQQVNILLPYHDDAACAYSETNERKAIVKYTNPAEAENHYLTLHPNPADKEAIIELNQLTENITEVLVYDIAGKKIENIQWQKIENGKASIDISHLANGFYTCIAKTNTNKAYYGKLAKQ